MRRGLMEWDPQELPVGVLEARIARLRAGMKSAGLDAFVIYTNLVRPSAVAHLTGFTPYWNEGLLLVPAAGRLVFATALSNRVADWIRSTNPVSEVVSTPRPGALLGERLAKDAAETGRRAGMGRHAVGARRRSRRRRAGGPVGLTAALSSPRSAAPSMPTSGTCWRAPMRSLSRRWTR